MNLLPTTVRNVSADWFAQAVRIAAFSVSAPILVGQLGRYEYGIWVTLSQTLALMMLLDLGVANSISVLVARHAALDDDEGVRRVFSSAMTLLTVVSVLVLLAGCAVLPLIPRVFSIEAPLDRTAMLVFFLATLNVALVLPLRVGRGLLQAKHRFDVVSKVSVLVALVRLAVLMLIFARGYGNVVLLAALTLGWNVAGELLQFVLAVRNNPLCHFGRQYVARQTLATLCSRGLSTTLLSVSKFLCNSIQVIAIGIFLGVATAPLYAIPCSVITMLSTFVHPLGRTVFPIASGMFALGEDEKLRRLSMLGVRYALAMGVPMAIYLLFYGGDVFLLWLGRSRFTAADLQTITWAAAVMGLSLALGHPHLTSRSVLSGIDRHWWVARTQVVCSVFGLAVGLALMAYTTLGVLGPAIGYAVQTLCCDALLFPAAVCRRLHIPVATYLRTVYLRPLLAALGLVACCLLMNQSIAATGFRPLAVKSLLFAAASLILFGYGCLLPQHRKSLLDLARSQWTPRPEPHS